MSIAEDLFNRGKKKLALWKARYSANEYPCKVAINTVRVSRLCMGSTWNDGPRERRRVAEFAGNTSVGQLCRPDNRVFRHEHCCTVCIR